MPNVGGRKFPYTPRGRAKAKAYSRASGQPMKNSGGNYGNSNNMKGNTMGGGRIVPANKMNRPAPVNRNAPFVNRFMNSNAMNKLNMNTLFNPNTRNVSQLQTGINFMNRNRPGYVPLKVDGRRGPITNSYASRYIGG